MGTSCAGTDASSAISKIAAATMPSFASCEIRYHVESVGREALDWTQTPGLGAQADSRHGSDPSGRLDARGAVPMIHAHHEIAVRDPLATVPSIDLRVDAERRLHTLVVDEHSHELDRAEGDPLGTQPQ
jgi:hypothetical protein